MLDAAANSQLKQISAYIFGFSLEASFPRKLLTKVVMKRWMLRRGAELGNRCQRVMANVDPEYKVDWLSAGEFELIWQGEKATGVQLRSYGVPSLVLFPASMSVDATWKAKNLHDDMKASIESPDGFTKPTFREVYKRFAVGDAVGIAQEHFAKFDAMHLRELAETLHKEHEDMQRCISYEAQPDILKTAKAKQIASAKAKRAPPKKNLAVPLRISSNAAASAPLANQEE